MLKLSRSKEVYLGDSLSFFMTLVNPWGGQIKLSIRKLENLEKPDLDFTFKIEKN